MGHIFLSCHVRSVLLRRFGEFCIHFERSSPLPPAEIVRFLDHRFDHVRLFFTGNRAETCQTQDQ